MQVWIIPIHIMFLLLLELWLLFPFLPCATYTVPGRLLSLTLLVEWRKVEGESRRLPGVPSVPADWRRAVPVAGGLSSCESKKRPSISLLNHCWVADCRFAGFHLRHGKKGGWVVQHVMTPLFALIYQILHRQVFLREGHKQLVVDEALNIGA